jgi:hypothetical protein
VHDEEKGESYGYETPGELGTISLLLLSHSNKLQKLADMEQDERLGALSFLPEEINSAENDNISSNVRALMSK